MKPLEMLCGSFKCVGFDLNHIQLFACEKRETQCRNSRESIDVSMEKHNSFLSSVTRKVGNLLPGLAPCFPIFWVV